jgi:hypothetical protein
LDYFGTRYYSSSLGHWLSPDPVPISRDLANPQTHNKYSYAFNSPLVLTDPDGRWPAEFHHIVVHDVFGNLGQHAEQVLDAASDWVDSVEAGNQAPERSFMHAMRDGAHNQTVEEAQHLTENYITTEVHSAVDTQIAYEEGGGKGYSDAALTSFGHALHTVTDRTSPEHAGYQPWYCLVCWPALQHRNQEEKSASSSNLQDEEARYQAHVEAARLWYRFLDQLEKARKKNKKPALKSPGPVHNKGQSGYSVGPE